MHYTDYDTRLAAYAVVVDQGGPDGTDRILLALWNEADDPQWTMPGGGVEYDETVEQAAVRELREETGYDVELVRVLGVDTHLVTAGDRTSGPAPRRALKGVRVVFEARIVGGELTREIDGTTDEARWIPLAEVPSLRRVSLVDAAVRMWEQQRLRP